jgi:hypothetical protein
MKFFAALMSLGAALASGVLAYHYLSEGSSIGYVWLGTTTCWVICCGVWLDNRIQFGP